MCNISIPDFIQSLDYDQLTNLIEKATAKKAAKDSESKIWVHQVTTHTICENFRSDDLEGAAKFIGERMMKIATSDEKISEKVYQMTQVGLNSFKEVESEYESWF